MRQRLRQLRSTSGFTLIELMVTIAVLAILVSLAVPALNLVEQRRVIGAGESALNYIQTARSEAIKQGRDMFFVSAGNDGNWCYGVSQTQNCDCFLDDIEDSASCAIILAENEVPVLFRKVSDEFRNIEMSGGGEELRINYVRGTITPVSPESIRFESSPNGFELEMQINPIGRPRLCGPEQAMGAYRECP